MKKEHQSLLRKKHGFNISGSVRIHTWCSSSQTRYAPDPFVFRFPGLLRIGAQLGRSEQIASRRECRQFLPKTKAKNSDKKKKAPEPHRLRAWATWTEPHQQATARQQLSRQNAMSVMRSKTLSRSSNVALPGGGWGGGASSAGTGPIQTLPLISAWGTSRLSASQRKRKRFEKVIGWLLLFSVGNQCTCAMSLPSGDARASKGTLGSQGPSATCSTEKSQREENLVALPPASHKFFRTTLT